MLSILQQPYPYESTPQRNIAFSVGAGIFVAFFLVYFEPFTNAHAAETIPNLDWLLAAYGLVTTGIMLFAYLGLPALFTAFFKEENWTVSKHIFFMLLVVTAVSIGNFLYSYAVDFIPFTFNAFYYMIGCTLAVGIFPCVTITLISYIFHLRKYSTPPQPIHIPEIEEKQRVQEVTFVAENEKDTILVHESELLFIESNDNYATIHFTRNESINKELIRSSLSRLEGQITSEDIVRCHRSYIVNLARVTSVSGNAQGFKLHLDDGTSVIPVARKNSSIVEQFRGK